MKHGFLTWVNRWCKYVIRRFRTTMADLLVGALLFPISVTVSVFLLLRQKTVLVFGLDHHPKISLLVSCLEPELRRRLNSDGTIENLIAIDFAPYRNDQLILMYSRVIKFYGAKNRCRRIIFWYASRLSRRVRVLEETYVWPTVNPLISFLPSEVNFGMMRMKTTRAFTGEEFICYGIRSTVHHLALQTKGNKLLLNASRNPDEMVYLKSLTQFCGGRMPIVRMGLDVKDQLDEKLWPNIFDYAYGERDDFMDCFLLSQCKFLVNGASGLFWLGAVFNSKAVHCDSYDIRVNCLRGNLQIIQRIWLDGFSRFATFKEMLHLPYYSKDKVQKANSISLVKNTVEEIKAVCDEMNARIDGTWVSTAEDEELQRRYQDLIVKYSNKPEWNGGGRIGAQFLRENQDLLRE